MSESRFVCKIVAKADSDAAEIMVYDDIGASWFGEGVTAKQFLRDLSALDASNITVRINSAGGDVFEGLAIHNAIKRHKANVVVEIDALAASIASIIALAGDEVRMSDNAFFMIHDPSGLNHGTAEDMRAMADLLDKVGGSLANVYAQKTGMDVEEIQALMKAETWFDASEAKDMGFVDGVTKGKKMAARADISAFSNTPKALRAAISAAEPEPTPAPVGGTEPVVSLPPTQPAPEAKGEPVENNTAAQAGAGQDAATAIAAERDRVKQIRALGKEHGVTQDKIDGWLDNGGTTVAQVKDSILAQIKAQAAETPSVSARVGAPRADADPRRGFESHRDFLVACMENAGYRSREHVADERLRPLAVLDKDDRVAAGELAFMLPSAFTPKGIRAAVGSDEQGAYSDPHGGFAVPTSTLPGLLQLGPEADPTAGRTQSIPMATPQVDMVARTDKNHSTSVSGGFTVTRKPETTAASDSRAQIEKVSLKATSLFGLAYATEEILTDSAISFAAIIANGFRDQFAFHMFNEKLRGLGGSEYEGVISAPGTVSVAKETSQTADTIVAENLIKMRSRCWGYGNAIWIANHEAYTQLIQAAIVKEGSVGGGLILVYQPSLVSDRPDMLLGRPIFYTEHAEALGDKGDIVLGNWSQYLEGQYQPLQSAESMHVRFVNHERAFKFWTRNAGAPWWRSALTPHKGAATLSPFVTLAERG